MSTYHVVTTAGETRVEGTDWDDDGDIFTIYNGDGGTFMCPMRALVYVKRVEESKNIIKTVVSSPAEAAEISRRLMQIKQEMRDVYSAT